MSIQFSGIAGVLIFHNYVPYKYAVHVDYLTRAVYCRNAEFKVPSIIIRGRSYGGMGLRSWHLSGTVKKGTPRIVQK